MKKVFYEKLVKDFLDDEFDDGEDDGDMDMGMGAMGGGRRAAMRFFKRGRYVSVK